MKVLNKKTDKVTINSVYIGRPSKWGNPFVIGPDGTREEVIEKYRKYILFSDLIHDIPELVGKDLVCWCSPAPCHGDILVSLAQEYLNESMFENDKDN